MTTSAGHVFKAVSAQLAEMDEMDVPEKDWNIFDIDELTTAEVIEVLSASSTPSHKKFAGKLQGILDREEDWEEEN